MIVNEEETNTWCGNETRPCVNCQNGQPAATDDRDNADQCADRLMSGRLHSRLKLLQRLANREWPNRKQNLTFDVVVHKHCSLYHRSGASSGSMGRANSNEYWWYSSCIFTSL